MRSPGNASAEIVGEGSTQRGTATGASSSTEGPPMAARQIKGNATAQTDR